MRKFFIIPVSFYLFTSCIATHMGSISTSSIGKNVSYEDIAYGVSQSERYFGFGGNGQDAMVLEAKRELMKNRPLSANEEYINFTIDSKNTIWPFYRQTKVTLSADVIKFTNDSIDEPFSENYKNKLLGKSVANPLFHIGDSIIDFDMNEGVIIAFNNPNKVRIIYKSKSDKTKSKKIALDKIYTKTNAYNGYKSGDSYVYISDNKGVTEHRVRKIVAVGLKAFILEDHANEFLKVEYKN